MRKVILAVLMMLLAVSARAGDVDYPIKTFYWENDDIFLPGGVDRYYTNGMRFTMIRDPKQAGDRVVKLREAFCNRGWCSGMDPAETVGIVVGHSFYTPEDIERRAPQRFDRPFAGWFYAGGQFLISDKKQIGDKDADGLPLTHVTRQHSFEATVGILGPAAQAEFIQREWHAMPFINGRVPRGWDNQLKNEPTLQFVYQQSWRTGSTSFDVIPTVTAAVGTVQIYGGVGVTARVGKNISGFGVPIIPVAVGAVRQRSDLEYYFFAGADTRFIAHTAFLDGGAFRDGPSVQREDYVNDLRIGGSVRWKSFRTTYTYVQRSQEFDPLPGRDGRHRFASIAISVERPLNF